MPDYDYVIVGGGISGLMTTLRLAKGGFRVGLFEKSEIGSEASISNHGMIHSGALYSEFHPDVAAFCREANTLFHQSFPDAIVPLQDTWYFASPARLEQFQQLWQRLGIPFTNVEQSAWSTLLKPEFAGNLACSSLPDFVVSPRRILVELVQMCLDAGAEVSAMTPVHEIILRHGAATGIRIGLRETVSAHTVVLSSGLGLIPLLKQVGSRAAEQLRPRLSVMALFENVRLNRSLLCLEHGGPTIAPTYGSAALVSLFNGPQPRIGRSGRWPLTVAQVAEIEKQVKIYLQEDVLSMDTGKAYVCSKTEIAIINTTRSTKPVFVCMNHEKMDGIKHLWSLLPGKFTLSFHATHSLVGQMLREDVGLPLPSQPHTVSSAAEDIVAIEPWWDSDQRPFQSYSNRQPSNVIPVTGREQPASLLTEPA